MPRIVFTKGGGPWLEAIAACGADVVGRRLDRATSARRGRASATAWRCKATSIPTVLFAPPDVVRAQARSVLADFGPPRRADGRLGGHVFNLGHGISQHTPPEHVHALVDEVHRHSRTRSLSAAWRK